MNAQDVFVGGGLGREKILRRGHVIRQEPLADQVILLRRKDVRTQIQIVAVVVDELEWQHDESSLPRSFVQRKRRRSRTRRPPAELHFTTSTVLW